MIANGGRRGSWDGDASMLASTIGAPKQPLCSGVRRQQQHGEGRAGAHHPALHAHVGGAPAALPEPLLQEEGLAISIIVSLVETCGIHDKLSVTSGIYYKLVVFTPCCS